RPKFFVPIFKRAAQRGRPFQLEVTFERSLHFEWLLGLDVDFYDCSRFVHGNKERLANRKCVAAVDQRERLRPSGCGPHHAFRRNNPAFGEKEQIKVAQDLQWISPALKLTSFIAKHASALTDRASKLPGARGARKLEAVRRTAKSPKETKGSGNRDM